MTQAKTVLDSVDAVVTQIELMADTNWVKEVIMPGIKTAIANKTPYVFKSGAMNVKIERPWILLDRLEEARYASAVLPSYKQSK